MRFHRRRRLVLWGARNRDTLAGSEVDLEARDIARMLALFPAICRDDPVIALKLMAFRPRIGKG